MYHRLSGQSKNGIYVIRNVAMEYKSSGMQQWNISYQDCIKMEYM